MRRRPPTADRRTQVATRHVRPGQLRRLAMSRLDRVLPLPRAGRIYYAFVAAAALAVGGAAVSRLGASTPDWLTFLLLASAAAVAQVFIVRTGRSHGFHTAIIFIVAGALLLPPELVVLMVVVQHLPEWVKERYPWFIQTFNIANFALASLAAWAVANAIAPNNFHGNDGRAALAGLAAGLVLVAVNHTLLATMLRLGRGVSFVQSGLFGAESLGGDIVLAGLGIAFAMVLRTNIWLVPAIIAPLVLSHRSTRLLGMARDSEQRFRTMFEAAPIGMIVRDLDGRLLSTNPAFERMVGYSNAELEHLDPAALIPAEHMDETRELHDALLCGGRDGYEQEQQFIAKDGSEVWGRVDVTLVRDAGQRPQFVLSMVQDVTQHKLLEDQLRQAQKMEAIGRLAGGVAHDFNNLLTAISGYANLVLDRLRERDSDLTEDVREIDKAAQRAHSLTRQLLAFSRKQLLQPQVLNVNDVVGDMDTMLRRLIGENIEIVTVYGSGLSRVQADPGQLQQVIINLVVNARDEMPGGGTLSIETANATISAADASLHDSEVQAGSFVTFTIRDTGRGMDEATKARLFEPFFTKKGGRQRNRSRPGHRLRDRQAERGLHRRRERARRGRRVHDSPAGRARAGRNAGRRRARARAGTGRGRVDPPLRGRGHGAALRRDRARRRRLPGARRVRRTRGAAGSRTTTGSTSCSQTSSCRGSAAPSSRNDSACPSSTCPATRAT